MILADTLQLNSSFAYWPPPYGIIRTPWDQWIQQVRFFFSLHHFFLSYIYSRPMMLSTWSLSCGWHLNIWPSLMQMLLPLGLRLSKVFYISFSFLLHLTSSLSSLSSLGMPYGWHNFVYTFIDTMVCQPFGIQANIDFFFSQYDNLPRPASPDLMEQVFGIYEPRVCYLLTFFWSLSFTFFHFSCTFFQLLIWVIFTVFRFLWKIKWALTRWLCKV